MTDLAEMSQRTVGHARLARRLADDVEEMRYTLPVGAAVQPDHTGISRPVEATVVACHTHGVSDHARYAYHELATADRAIERAIYRLDAARRAWTKDEEAICTDIRTAEQTSDASYPVEPDAEM